MIDAAERNEVALIAAGARSFDPAFVAMRQIVDSGRLGGWARSPPGPIRVGSFVRESPYEVDVALGGGTATTRHHTRWMSYGCSAAAL